MSSYIAKVKLVDKETYNKDWEQEGEADKVLMNAIKFLNVKDGNKVFRRIINYLAQDFEVFDKIVKEEILGIGKK